MNNPIDLQRSLNLSAYYGNIGRINQLLTLGADINASCPDNESLAYAMTRNCSPLTLLFTITFSIIDRTVDTFGENASCFLFGAGAVGAAYFFPLVMAGGILGLGACVFSHKAIENYIYNKIANWPPLFFAACNGKLDAALLLIEKGAVERKDIHGISYSYMSIAVEYNQHSFVNELLQHKQDQINELTNNDSLKQQKIQALQEEISNMRVVLDKKEQYIDRLLQQKEQYFNNAEKLNIALKAAIALRETNKLLSLKLNEVESNLKKQKASKTTASSLEKPTDSNESLHVNTRHNFYQSTTHSAGKKVFPCNTSEQPAVL